MEAGLSETVWNMDDLVRIMDERAPEAGTAQDIQQASFKLMHYRKYLSISAKIN